VGTDRYMYFTLSWDAEKKELNTEKSYVDIADKAARDVQSGDRCLVDPTRRIMVLEVLEGVLTVVPLTHKGKKKNEFEVGNLEDPIHTRIPELFVRSSTFLLRKHPSHDRPRIALLYEDNASKMQLKVRQLNYTPGASGDVGSVSLEESEDLETELDPGASHLIPVSEPACKSVLLHSRGMYADWEQMDS
jgi:DNA damage-binding protein 1